MIFNPYPDEKKVIENVQKLQNNEYAIVRMTKTMMDKNNTDCNGFFRTMLKKMSIVDYESLDHGKDAGVMTQALFIMPDKTELVDMNFYIVNNDRGDKRWSFYGLKQRGRIGDICEGDLLYFSTYQLRGKTKGLFVINLTHNTPEMEYLSTQIGVDEVNQVFESIKGDLKRIVQKDKYVPNVKGKGKEAPKDVGETLEYEMRVETNNRRDADIKGILELKGKGSKATKDTLLTLRPSFEGTYIERMESNDKHRVKVFPLFYGYDSEKHAGCKDLYITIGCQVAPQNKHGFYLVVDEEKSIVKLMGPGRIGKKDEMTAFWTFDALEKALNTKHKATLWITADKKIVDDTVMYNYKKIEFSRSPKFATFISLIKSGEVTYDWRGHTSMTDKYAGVNKGNAWRIKPRSRKELFGSLEVVEFE